MESSYTTVIFCFSCILIFLSLYSGQWEVFFLAIVLLLFIFFNQFYLKNAGKELLFVNQKKRDKYFIDKDGSFQLTFINNGLPILGGEIRISFHSIVSPKDIEVESRQHMYEMKLPFSIQWKQRKSIVVPFVTERRGSARIRKIELSIPNYFGLGTIVLENDFYPLQEVLVYPKTLEVKNKQVLQVGKDGDTYAVFSIYEDTLSPAGTREYLYSDSFHRIHWKASARNQALQTKVFDKVSESGWHFSVRVRDFQHISDHLEELLSAITDLAYFFTKERIPFSVAFNLYHAGPTPFIYIASGSGREHLQRVLETIALIDSNAPMIPYEKMMAYYTCHLEIQPFLLEAGLSEQEEKTDRKDLKRNGIQVYELKITEQKTATIIKKTTITNGRKSS